MLDPVALDTLSVWRLLTRLGEAEILLPVALLTAAGMALRADQRRLAAGWMLLLCAAGAITTASKLAFLGWGIGSATINFTGISGHTMFASAIYPLVARTWLAGGARTAWQPALLLGWALALLVGVSRIAVGAHSWSEVVAGWLLGGGASVALLAWGEGGTLVLRPMVSVLVLAWLAVTAGTLPPSQTHSMVTRLALKLSGHVVPFTRAELLRRDGQPES